MIQKVLAQWIPSVLLKLVLKIKRQTLLMELVKNKMINLKIYDQFLFYLLKNMNKKGKFPEKKKMNKKN